MKRLSSLPVTRCALANGTSRVSGLVVTLGLHRPRSRARLFASLPAATIFVASSIPVSAAAQSASYYDQNNNVSVMDRPRPDYQALGVQVGSFQLFPVVTGTEAYDDNIFATTTGRDSDWITTMSPSIDLKSNWSRNSLELTASDVSNFYGSHTTEDTNDYKFNLAGQIDTSYQSSFSGSFGYGHYSLPRTSEVTLGDTSSPVEYDGLNANVAAVQTLNRLRVVESVTLNRTAYANAADAAGDVLPLSQLDNDQVVANLRTSWAINPDIALSASATYNVRRYDDSPPLAPLDRNSDGYEATVGADFDITRLIRGQVQVGYLSQHYQSPLFHDVSGPDVHAKVEYFLSGLTTITLHADRTVIDDIDPVSISFLETQGGVRIDHELLRNLILSGRLDYENDDFTGVLRNDRRTTASARGTYLMNRHLGFTAAYSIIDVQSSGAARIGGYEANVISLSVVFQL
jgi:hypothetical protein